MSILSMSELDEMIRRGWGDVPRDKIPADWRERVLPAFVAPAYFGPGEDPEKRKVRARKAMRRVYAQRAVR